MSDPRVDLRDVMEALKRRRPVFHLEADFQFAFAWEVKLLYPHVELRLEVPITRSERLDVKISDASNNEIVAVELKYLTRQWAGEVEGEAFALANQSANDTRRYDVVKDIHRVETFIENETTWTGAAIILTNEPAYWKPPQSSPVSLDAAFRIHEGGTLSGTRAWKQLTTSSKGRTNDLDLAGEYTMAWSDYSTLDGSHGGSLRYLAIPIAGRETGRGEVSGRGQTGNDER